MLPKANPDPFPHLVVDGLWPDDLLTRVRAEFPHPDDPRWHWFGNDLERKAQGGQACWGPATQQLLVRLGSPRFRAALCESFGLSEDLILGTEGGGMHMIPPGGYLGVHADFNRASDGLWRRINVLVYLNRGWLPEWRGQLELWDGDGPVVSLDPAFNRTVAFLTSDTSYHGHPHPTSGPEARCSVAAYYFTAEPPAGASSPHSTLFHPNQPKEAT